MGVRVHCACPTTQQDGAKGQRYLTAASQTDGHVGSREMTQARCCDKQLVSTSGPKMSEQVERTFNRLILQGRVCSAVRLLTERGGGRVLDPRQEVGRQAPWRGLFSKYCKRNTQTNDLLIPVLFLNVTTYHHWNKWPSLQFTLKLSPSD